MAESGRRDLVEVQRVDGVGRIGSQRLDAAEDLGPLNQVLLFQVPVLCNLPAELELDPGGDGFAPCDLAVSLLSPPEVNGSVPTFITQTCAYLLEGVNLSDASAPITPNPLGMSIFFVTPALLLIFAARRREPPFDEIITSATVSPNPMRILSGIQPSGTLHLGNYFGAMRQHLALQAENEAFYFIAAYHALTTVQDGDELRRVGPRVGRRGEVAPRVEHEQQRVHDQGAAERNAIAAAGELTALVPNFE